MKLEYVCVCVMMECVVCYQSRGVNHSQIVAIKHGAPEGGEKCHCQQRPSQLLQTEERCVGMSRAINTGVVIRPEKVREEIQK